MLDVKSAPPHIFRTGRECLSRLRILATSDLHAHITPWDYHSDRSSAAIGLARTANLITRARAEVESCLLVDNGDFLQGSPLGDIEAQRDQGEGRRQHPMIAAMNALGYDAATLGNHEFSFGLEFLMRHLAEASFPVVATNLVRRLGATPLLDEALVPPRLILERQLRDWRGDLHPLRIGIIGLAPPQTVQWDRAKLGTALAARDILEAAAAHVPVLRAEGADVVLALSHSGIGAARSAPGMENASAALAALPGIDALVAGHTHQVFPTSDFPAGEGIDAARGHIWGKPVVMPGFFGSHLGLIDLDLYRSEGRWRVVAGESLLRPIARRAASGRLRALTRSAGEIMALAEPAHQAMRAWAQATVAQTTTALHSYFAMVAPSRTVRLVARAQAAHVARALQGGIYSDLPVLSAAAPFHAGGRGGPGNYTHVAQGNLTMRHVFDLYPHPNTIAALLVTGADLQDWLERAFSQFARVTPGAQDAPLLDPEFPSFNFDMIEGLDWQVDLSAPPRHDSRGEVVNPGFSRIRDLRFAGQPLPLDRYFVLATNGYRANGSGGFGAARPERIILNGPHNSRDILRDHIAQGGKITGTGPANWRFVAMPGTSVLFDSAPAAAAHLADLAPLRADPLATTALGFRRFRLHL
jgi:2',3'-cyclic-nucleotide 2'-phosphodiesterase/3'-nucleotidase